MGTLLDTSVLIDVERRQASLPADEELAIAAITAAELLFGVHQAAPRHRVRRETFVEDVLTRLPTVAFSLPMARVHARLRSELAAAGRIPGLNDLAIAATALVMDWPIATLDLRGFAQIPGIRLRPLKF